MFRKRVWLVAGLLLFALHLAAQEANAPAGGSIQGKLWLVPVGVAGAVAFPVPTATPDATFSTNGITYIGQFIGRNPALHCFTIQKFLSGCATVSYNLTFSGLTNPNLGGVVSGSTPMGGTNYGVLIEFTGNVSLTNGQEISILHDDGVALNIDGASVSGFGNSVNIPLLQSVTFTGTTGTHAIDLLYGNDGGAGDGAWLMFFPKFF